MGQFWRAPRCRTGKTEFVVHIEAVTRFKRAALERQFDYVQAIVAKYKLPCRSFLVLLTEKGVPKTLPRALHRRNGDHTATLRMRFVRLWRISATRILRMKNPQLLPWTPLLDSSPADLRQALAQLEANDEDILTARLLLLGGLRYGSREAFLESAQAAQGRHQRARNSPIQPCRSVSVVREFLRG